MRRLVAFAVASVLAVGSLGATSASAASHHHTRGKITNSTFGAAPSSPKGADGRPYFTFDSTPGGQLTDHVAITNFSNQAEKLAIYAVDATSASNGTISFAPQSAPRTAAGAWIAVGTPGGKGEIVLKPRTTDVLPVNIKVPSNAPPGDHVGAVVVSLAGVVSGRFGKGGVQKVTFNQRIAVRAVFRIGGQIHPLLTVQNLKASYDGPIDPFARGQVKVTYLVHNGGNVVLGGPQLVSVHGLFGEQQVAPVVAPVPALLPGASYPVTVRVPNVYPELLMSAKVTVTAQGLQGDVDPGLHSVTSSVHFLAIPWILLVVLLLLILGLGWAYWRRRRAAAGRHRTPPGAEDSPQPVDATEIVSS